MIRARLLLAGLVASAALLMLPHAVHAANVPAGCTSGRGCSTSRQMPQSAAIHLCRTAQRVGLGAALGLASIVAGAGGERLLALTPLTCSGMSAADGVAWNWQVQPPRHSTSSRPSGTRHTGRALHLPAYTPLGAAQDSSSSASIDVPQLLAKVVIVFLLLFVCLRVLKAVMPRLNGASGGAAGGLVLHSEPLGPKARLQVLDLGLRVVMVAVSGPTITTLATIDDAAEMAELRERYAHRGRKGLGRRKEPKEQDERPSFVQALALTSRQALGRGAAPAANTAPAPRESVAPAREWEQELAAAMAAPAPQGSHDGDPVLGGALESLRSLRRQVERR